MICGFYIKQLHLFIFLLMSYCGINALIPNSGLSQRLRLSSQQLAQYKDEYSDEVPREFSDLLPGEPKWFQQSAQNKMLVDSEEIGVISPGTVRRNLPLYLLKNELCFPTGLS